MTETSTGPEVEEAWETAVDFWGIHISLSPPAPLGALDHEYGGPSDAPIAYIDLESRQVVVNFERLRLLGAGDSLTAVLAHEVGHHVEFPRTLGLMAELEVMERRLLPHLDGSLVNLFLDLQVNEVVGREWADELCAVYRGSAARGSGRPNPVFVFYLTIYEELWGREPGRLVDAVEADELDVSEVSAWMDEAYPGWRGEARLFSQTFFGLPGTHLQFVYFCSVFNRYVWDPDREEFADVPMVPLGGDAPEPEPSDYSGAIRSSYSGEIDDAIQEGKERGWIRPDEVSDSEEMGGAFGMIDALVRTGHGSGEGEFRRALVEREYARLVDRHLFALPADGEPPEASKVVPTTVEPWEFGENPHRINWIESVLQKGPLAGAEPMRFEYRAPEPRGGERGPRDLEIYLDTSGSMPDPTRALNAMTLAAQILSAAAIRDEGRVRAVVYSAGEPLVSDWMYDERVARRFLLHFMGAGTQFPFEVLEEWTEDARDATRVIISDDGFRQNLRNSARGPSIVEGAVERSNPLVAMLADWYPESEETPSLLPVGRDRFRLVRVEDVAELSAAASQLADAFFD